MDSPLVVASIIGVVSTTVALHYYTSSFPASATDTDVVDEIGIEIPVSCTMSGTGTNSHTASIPNGIYSGTYTDPSTNTNYASGIGTTTIKAFCNDNQGFSIYAIGYTDNEEGKNVLTNQTLGSTYDIITGTATGPVGSNDISNWSMKLGTITSPTPTYPIIIAGSASDTDKQSGDPDYSTFQSVPDDYTLVAKRTSSTDVGQNAVGSTLTTTYAAYISKTQPAGLYKGQVKYTMVHPYDTAKPEKQISINTATYLQEVNSCPDTLTTGEVYTLKDSRDETEYHVARLADGKCWMLDNLALDLTNSTVKTKLTSATTNATDESISYLLGTNTRNPSTDPNGKYATSGVSISSDYSYSVPHIVTSFINTTNTADTLSDDARTWKYGVLYNYCAATAGSYCYGNGNNSVKTTVDADEDICPSGWRMPTGGYPDGDYYNLSRHLPVEYPDGQSSFYGDVRDAYRSTLHLPYSGQFGTQQASQGYWWSSTRASTTYTYYLRDDGGVIYHGRSNATNSGYAVRCVLK